MRSNRDFFVLASFCFMFDSFFLRRFILSNYVFGEFLCGEGGVLYYIYCVVLCFCCEEGLFVILWGTRFVDCSGV